MGGVSNVYIKSYFQCECKREEKHMINGVDSANNLSGIAQQLKNSGYQFVIRYYSLAGNAKE